MLITFLLFALSALAIDRSKFDKLTIYQPMVSTFIDGSKEHGYTLGYGPSGTSFGGDLEGVISYLPEIKKMGFNAIWMTPIFDSSSNNSSCTGEVELDSTGYFANNYFEIDPHFGTKDTFRELVNKAHELGLYVILDGVFGHYKVKPESCAGVVPSPSGLKPTDNGGNTGGRQFVKYPESLPFFIEVAKYWIENYEIDGWRLDQVYQISENIADDTTSTDRENEKPYTKEIREAIENLCDERAKSGKRWGTLGYIVGEDWEGNVDNVIHYDYRNEGDALYSYFDFPSYYQFVKNYAQESYDKVEEMRKPKWGICFFDYLTNVYPKWAHPNMFLGSHDLVRLGNLIRYTYKVKNGDDNYYKLLFAPFVFQSTYSGPITFFYADEYAVDVGCFKENGDCGANVDNSGRINLPLEPNEKENIFKQNISTIMNFRLNHPVMYHKDAIYDRKDDMKYLKQYTFNETTPKGGINEITECLYVFMNNDDSYVNVQDKNVAFNDLQCEEMTDVLSGEVIKKGVEIKFEAYQTRLMYCKNTTIIKEESSRPIQSSSEHRSNNDSSSGPIQSSSGHRSNNDSSSGTKGIMTIIVISLLLLL